MNHVSRQQATAADIARLRSDVERYAEFLGQPADRFLDGEFVSYATGIEPARVRELLAGALPEVEPDDKTRLEAFQKTLFQQRLVFLRRTRTAQSDAGEAPYTLDEIERRTSITKQMVSYLLNGKRSPNAAHAARLEEFFDWASQQRLPRTRVPQGFCLRNEGAALVAHLTQMVSSDLPRLTLASLAQDLETSSLALRASGDAGDIDLVKLLPILAQLRSESRERSMSGN
ncbi:helix-turn-helix domain-containing protein [Streptomyces humi]